MRSKFIFSSFIIFYSILLFRIGFLSYKAPVRKFYNKVEVRKEILDCQNEVLAFTEETKSIYCIPHQLNSNSISFIKQTFNIDINIHKKKSFLWLKRHASQNEINVSKHKKGIIIIKDHRRVYPYANNTSHIIGYCDRNLHGKSGAELSFNTSLINNTLQLTIDIRIQNILHNIIKEISEEFESEDASGIIVDVESGEVKAMVSYPSPNSNIPSTYLKKENRNHNLSAIEVGSILKLHNAAMCLENQIVNLDSVVDATGTLQIGEFEVTDFFGKDKKMTFLESVRFSSNIATGRLALEIGVDKQKNFFRKIGFLNHIEWLPNQFAKPLLPKRWGKSTVVTASYGYGIGLTSLHITQSLMRILSGKSRNITFYASNNQSNKEEKIISKHTIESIKIIMRTIIKSAYRSINIDGYEIGGKTGTANMCENGVYVEGKNRVSYLGAFPMHRPKYIFLIQTTNPKKSKLKYGRYVVASNVLTQKVRYAVQEIASIENIEPI
ncbi:penicillin-binding transpeptidase domain-containing protein [Candidatus Cytomitobacter primus]|uniref:Uncharacterized protein n=1 Tax=Candidatus Cytomitobacter primus TaxID=2066024 RepID=A0A5C0UEY5_9PROT|nr:penicillin-binding transpeptidase domain-containing protein [Candidatus Cytomitobacter primus]QEK38618.1 hypothetical protein FZC34_01705 [Candidatus Cytomitobacter primus]